MQFATEIGFGENTDYKYKRGMDGGLSRVQARYTDQYVLVTCAAPFAQDMHREAAAAPEGCIEINFLTRDIVLGKHSQSLAQAIKLMRKNCLSFAGAMA